MAPLRWRALPAGLRSAPLPPRRQWSGCNAPLGASQGQPSGPKSVPESLRDPLEHLPERGPRVLRLRGLGLRRRYLPRGVTGGGGGGGGGGIRRRSSTRSQREKPRALPAACAKSATASNSPGSAGSTRRRANRRSVRPTPRLAAARKPRHGRSRRQRGQLLLATEDQIGDPAGALCSAGSLRCSGNGGSGTQRQSGPRRSPASAQGGAGAVQLFGSTLNQAIGENTVSSASVNGLLLTSDRKGAGGARQFDQPSKRARCPARRRHRRRLGAGSRRDRLRAGISTGRRDGG